MADGSATPAWRRVPQLVKFVIIGGINTLLTYAIFIGLGLLIEPWIAYTIAFAVGLAWTSIGSSRFVFGARFALTRILLFAGCYLVIYGIGRVIIQLVDPRTLGDLLVTSLIVLIATTPLVFIVGRFIFSRPKPEPVPPQTPEESQP